MACTLTLGLRDFFFVRDHIRVGEL